MEIINTHIHQSTTAHTLSNDDEKKQQVGGGGTPEVKETYGVKYTSRIISNAHQQMERYITLDKMKCTPERRNLEMSKNAGMLTMLQHSLQADSSPELSPLSKDKLFNALAVMRDKSTLSEELNPDVLADSSDNSRSVFRNSSSWDIYSDLADAIRSMDDEYLSEYENAVSKYSDFFKDFTDFKGRINLYINAADDGKISFWGTGFVSELSTLIAKYSQSPDNVLYPKEGKKATREEAEAWAKELGLPDICVEKQYDGSWACTIDITALKNIKNVTPNGTVVWNSAKYQAWNAGFDAQAEQLTTTMQTITQKYSSASSSFDNLVKVLSSTISSLLETDKAFFAI